jgi:hypothetical protein
MAHLKVTWPELCRLDPMVSVAVMVTVNVPAFDG